MAKECALSTGNLLQGGLPRNSVDRITDGPDMTLAVSNQKLALALENRISYCKFEMENAVW